MIALWESVECVHNAVTHFELLVVGKVFLALAVEVFLNRTRQALALPGFSDINNIPKVRMSLNDLAECAVMSLSPSSGYFARRFLAEEMFWYRWSSAPFDSLTSAHKRNTGGSSGVCRWRSKTSPSIRVCSSSLRSTETELSGMIESLSFWNQPRRAGAMISSDSHSCIFHVRVPPPQLHFHLQSIFEAS